MKKNIKFELAGKKYSVDVERQGDSLTIENEGKTITVNLLEGERKAPKPRPQVAAAAAPAAPSAPAPSAVTPTAGSGDVVAPMTGTIKEIKVSKGDKVSESQLVVIMEAMKMDIEVFSPISGTVVEVYLGPGSSVKENQPVVKLA